MLYHIEKKDQEPVVRSVGDMYHINTQMAVHPVVARYKLTVTEAADGTEDVVPRLVWERVTGYIFTLQGNALKTASGSIVKTLSHK